MFRNVYQGELCACCYHTITIGYTVEVDRWELATPIVFRDSHLCLGCYTRMADSKLVDWDHYLRINPVSLASGIFGLTGKKVDNVKRNSYTTKQ